MPNIIRVPGGGQTKIPSDLAPLCPNFKVVRNGTKVKISADKIQLNPYTNMVQGGVWAWGKTRPTKPTGENTKLWSRAELITTGKPYDGLYAEDMPVSDVTNTRIFWMPENSGGSKVLVPYIISLKASDGVYLTRQNLLDRIGWGSTTAFDGSTVQDYLENTFLNSILDSNVVAELVNFTTNVNGSPVVTKCRVPTVTEIDSSIGTDGTHFPVFDDQTSRIAQDSTGANNGYWTMSYYSDGNVYVVSNTGRTTGYAISNTACVRPVIVLPNDFKVQQRPDGSYTVWNEQGLLTLADIEVSTDTENVILNGAEDLKDGGQDIASFIYAKNGYFGNEGALAVRSNLLNDVSATEANYPASNVAAYATQYATAEASSASISRTLSSSLRAIITSANLKYRYNDGSQYEFSAKGFVLSVSDLLSDFSSWNMGEAIPCFGTQTQRIAKKDDGITTGWWTRDNLDVKQNYFIDTAGGQTALTFSSAQGVRPCFILPLTAPIRLLADGAYDLVPEDPALAQSVSTLAGEEEVPLEIEIDWPESDPLIARQWVYNQKGVYQTMLLGGVASTEDDPAYSPVLAENTWAQIAEAVANNDPIVDSWQIGDTKDEVINGETLTFVIVGKDHDDLADGSGKAPLTFGMKNLMAETRQMNSSNTNSGSFAGSAMYSWLSGTIYPNLPTELKDAIKAVNKKTSSGGGSSSIRTDAMYLWLFSEIEIFGSTTYSYAGEGTQYPYFATASERIKRLSNGAGAASYWWERSPYRDASAAFCAVGTSGSADRGAAHISLGVCFGFCI